MRPILPGQLWIGNTGDTRRPEALFQNQIEAVVDLAGEEPVATLPREILYCRFPISDGGPNPPGVLRLAIDVVAALLRQSIPTLVFCSAGMSRSPAVIAAAQSLLSNRSPEEHLRQVTADSPHDVSPRLWAEVWACLQK